MTGIVLTDDAALRYAQAIKSLVPDIPVWSVDEPDAVDADVAISWAPPAGVYRRFPRLRLIHSIGAGVNRIVAERSGTHIPLCRIVDHEQAKSMAQYVLWGVLHFHRGMDALREAQMSKRWQRPEQRPAGKTIVGIMGMGVMGRTVATSIMQLGFSVRGWSREASKMPAILSYSENELASFLSGLDMVICLLPLTDATCGILSTQLFSSLNRGAKLIQVGRGEHLVEKDLLAALECGQLGGALIDVFPHEPLPRSSPIWTNDKVIATPHVAAISSTETVAAQILLNVSALRAGHALSNRVERERGY